MKQATLQISGRVQGVFYRAGAQREAYALGIVGYAHNNPDGTVTICAQGEQRALERFIEWCWKGPDRADVIHIQVHFEDIEKPTFKEFEVG